MGHNVYANMREIACKASSGKSICAFPDTCFTPPENPATPPGVPIPYPNTAKGDDTTEGTKNVKIADKEVLLKNVSYLKTSNGNEAGKTQKKGLLTTKTTGAAYFNSWSMDVMFEGKNVVRHLDLTTHNHGSLVGNTPPWPFMASMSIDADGNSDDPCKADKEKAEKACEGKDPCEDKKCKDANKCKLSEYGGSGSPNCCSGETGHHLLPNSLLQSKRGNASTNVSGLMTEGESAYNVNKGACVCVQGSGHSEGEHGQIHSHTKEKLTNHMRAGNRLTYDTAKSYVVEAHMEAFKDEKGKPQCEKKCLEAQIDESLKGCKNGEIEVRQKDGQTRADFEDCVALGGGIG